MLKFFQSRKILFALFTLLSVAALEMAGKEINAEQMTGYAEFIIGFAVSIALNPAYDENKLKEMFSDRRLWLSVLGLAIPTLDVFGIKIPIASENLIATCATISGLVITFGYQVGRSLPPKEPNYKLPPSIQPK